MDFELHTLSDELIFIRWLRDSSTVSENALLSLIEMLLDEAPSPIYFLTDAQDGLMTNPRALRRMADLTRHNNFGAAVSYGHKVSASKYYETFRMMAAPSHREDMVRSVDEALDTLETVRPGITTMKEA